MEGFLLCLGWAEAVRREDRRHPAQPGFCEEQGLGKLLPAQREVFQPRYHQLVSHPSCSIPELGFAGILPGRRQKGSAGGHSPVGTVPLSLSPIPGMDGDADPALLELQEGQSCFCEARRMLWGGKHLQLPLTCPVAQPETPELFLVPLPCPCHSPSPRGPAPRGPASVIPTSPFPFHPKVPLGEHRRQPGSQGNLPPSSSSSSSSRTPLCPLTPQDALGTHLPLGQAWVSLQSH